MFIIKKMKLLHYMIIALLAMNVLSVRKFLFKLQADEDDNDSHQQFDVAFFNELYRSSGNCQSYKGEIDTIISAEKKSNDKSEDSNTNPDDHNSAEVIINPILAEKLVVRIGDMNVNHVRVEAFKTIKEFLSRGLNVYISDLCIVEKDIDTENKEDKPRYKATVNGMSRMTVYSDPLVEILKNGKRKFKVAKEHRLANAEFLRPNFKYFNINV